LNRDEEDKINEYQYAISNLYLPSAIKLDNHPINICFTKLKSMLILKIRLV
jgi:hypothetical protein